MFKVENLAEMYHKVGNELFINGDKVLPRGQETLEILTPIIHIENPKGRLAYMEGRKFNAVYALVESYMLIYGTNKLKYFSEFNKNMVNFSDDGEELHGAYGLRTAKYLIDIVEHLREDNDTRQAVLTIYNSDFNIKTKDKPCTMNLQFLIRDNKLNLITYMRSNDIIWGTPYDIFMFTTLQEIIANTLGIDIGWYRHIPSSLHVYKQHYDLLHDMIFKCENVELSHDMNLKQYFALANDYVNFIDNDFIPPFLDNKMQQYKNIIINEKCFRDKIWASDNGLSITPNVPDWIKKFVKRWNIGE